MPDARANDSYALMLTTLVVVVFVMCVVLGLVVGLLGPFVTSLIAGASFIVGVVLGITVERGRVD